MEISKINTKDPAERGAFCQLLHPAYKHPMFQEGPNVDEDGRWNGKGEQPPMVGVTVKGAEAPSIKKYLKKTRARHMRQGRNQADVDADEAIEFVCMLVTEFHGITKDGVPLDGSSDEDKTLFFKQSDNLVIQVTRFSGESENFFTDAANN